MPFSKNLSSYVEMKNVLEMARKAGGGEYELATRGQAIQWRQKAHFYRGLLYNLEAAKMGSIPGFVPSTPWDDMSLELRDNVVIISFGKPKGKFTPAAEASAEAEPDSDLPVDVINLRKEMGLE